MRAVVVLVVVLALGACGRVTYTGEQPDLDGCQPYLACMGSLPDVLPLESCDAALEELDLSAQCAAAHPCSTETCGRCWPNRGPACGALRESLDGCFPGGQLAEHHDEALVFEGICADVERDTRAVW
jgi:hypothetical protein